MWVKPQGMNRKRHSGWEDSGGHPPKERQEMQPTWCSGLVGGGRGADDGGECLPGLCQLSDAAGRDRRRPAGLEEAPQRQAPALVGGGDVAQGVVWAFRKR